MPAIGTVAACSNERFAGFGGDLVVGGGDELSERALARSVHVLAQLKSGVWTDRHHGPGHVLPTNANLRLAETEARADRVRQASHDVPVADEQAGGPYFDQDGVRAGLWCRDLLEVQDIRVVTVVVLHDRLHGSPRGRSWLDEFEAAHGLRRPDLNPRSDLESDDEIDSGAEQSPLHSWIIASRMSVSAIRGFAFICSQSARAWRRLSAP